MCASQSSQYRVLCNLFVLLSAAVAGEMHIIGMWNVLPPPTHFNSIENAQFIVNWKQLSKIILHFWILDDSPFELLRLFVVAQQHIETGMFRMFIHEKWLNQTC